MTIYDFGPYTMTIYDFGPYTMTIYQMVGLIIW